MNVRRALCIIVAAALAVTAPAAVFAKNVTVGAKIVPTGNHEVCGTLQFGTITVPSGSSATSFSITSLDAGINCATGAHEDQRGAWIKNQAGTHVYYYNDNVGSGKPPTETPVKLAALVLGPGKYTVGVDGGHDAFVTMQYRLTTGGGGGSRPCQSPVGTWAWWDGSTVTFLANGTATHSRGAPGTWKAQAGGRFHVHWPTWNTEDYFTISADGRTMAGVYAGNSSTSHRRTPASCLSADQPASTANTCASPVGTWAWIDSPNVTFYSNGTMRNARNGHGGTWERLSAGRFHLHWDYPTDDYLTLSADGKTLTGSYAANAGTSHRTSPCQ